MQKQEVPKTSFGDLIIRNGTKTISHQTSSGDLIRNGANTICLPNFVCCLGAIINGLYPSYPTQSAVIIHLLCYCTAVSMLSFLPVIVCGLLELKRICVGFLLIVWDGNESVQELYYLLGVDANLCRIFIDCLEWKWISAWSSLLAWSGNESV